MSPPPSPLALFPPQWKQSGQQFYEPMTAKKILGAQCVHSTLDSLALSTAFKCEGTIRQFKGKCWQLGSKICFTGFGLVKSNVKLLFKKLHNLLRFCVIGNYLLTSFQIIHRYFRNETRLLLKSKLSCSANRNIPMRNCDLYAKTKQFYI